MRVESTSALYNKISVLAIVSYYSNKFYEYTWSLIHLISLLYFAKENIYTILSQEINLMSIFFVK